MTSPLSTKLYSLLLAMLDRLQGRNQVVLERMIRSLPEAFFNPHIQRYIREIQVIRSAGAESYHFLQELAPAFRSEMHFARRHVYHLRDLSVKVRTSACLAGNFYLQESYGSLRRCLIDRPFPDFTGQKFTGGGTVTCVNHTTYYHFLLEEVPRLLWALEQHRDLKVVVHNSAPDYIRDILALISKLLDFSCEVVFTDTDVLQIPSYVFTQAEAYSGFVHGDDLLLLRKHLLKETTKRCHADKKIYLTRRNASRSFANEEQVAELMMNKGYDVVIPETMDFSSQIALSQDASVVVAPHGAGLANLLWCHPGTKIVEIFSPLYFNDCYARLSAQLKLPYRPLWAREGKGWGSVDLNKLAMTLDTLG